MTTITHNHNRAIDYFRTQHEQQNNTHTRARHLVMERRAYID